MKKMPTLFERQFENHEIIKCLNKVHDGCEWVLKGEGYATEKLDGTCCMIKDNQLYRRYDYKEGRRLPSGAVPCQKDPDQVTGHWPHWLLCDRNNPQDKYHFVAFDKQKEWEDGTYELLGLHEQGNPYNLDTDILEKHGKRILENVPRTFEGLKDYLENHYIEGIVFYRDTGEMCKIKRTDFGFEWNAKEDKK